MTEHGLAIRPLHRDDRGRLNEFFERLSEESRYRRFLSPMEELSSAQLDYLTQLDHHDHEAVVAVDRASDALVGVARYVRSPTDPDEAEVAVTVADDRQGQGLGTRLLRALVDRAREEGVSRFDAFMLADNVRMRGLLEEVGPIERASVEAGTIELKLPLPPAGETRMLRDWLRAGALGRLASRLHPH